MTQYQKRFQKLASELTLEEDGLSNVKVGDMRQVLSRLIHSPYHMLLLNNLHSEIMIQVHELEQKPKKKKRGKK